MDRSHLEPGNGLQQGVGWVPALLCGADGGAPAGDGPEELSEWLFGHLSSTDVGAAQAMEEAAVDFCKLHG